MVLNSDSSSDGWGDTREKIFGPKPQEVKLNLVSDSEKNDPLRAIKIEMHSILVSEQNPINGQEVLYKYCDMFGFDLNPRDYGYNDIDGLLQAMPDKIHVSESDGIYTYCAKPDDRVADIQSLVRRQLTKEQALAKKYNRRNTWKNGQNRTNRAPNNLQLYQNDPYSRNSQLYPNNEQYLKSQGFATAESKDSLQAEIPSKVADISGCPVQGNHWERPNEEDDRNASNISGGTKLNNMLKPKTTVSINNSILPQQSVANTSEPINHSLDPAASVSFTTSASCSKTSTRRDEKAKNLNFNFDSAPTSKQPHVLKAIVKRISFDDEPKSKSSLGRNDIADEKLMQTSPVEPAVQEPLRRYNSLASAEISLEAPALKFLSEDKESNVQAAIEESNAQNATEDTVILMADKKSHTQMSAVKSYVQMAVEESNVPDPTVETNIPVTVKKEEMPPDTTMTHSARTDTMSSSLLQMLALEAIRFLEDSDQKSTLLHIFVEMVHLFRTFLPNKTNEEQELQYLIEDLLCAL